MKIIDKPHLMSMILEKYLKYLPKHLNVQVILKPTMNKEENTQKTFINDLINNENIIR